MTTVGDLVDRGGLLVLTPGPAEKVHREVIGSLYEIAADTPLRPPASSVVHLPTSVWPSLSAPQSLPAALRSHGAVAVVVDTDDANLSAEFVAACVRQSLPIFMLPRSGTVADLGALIAPSVDDTGRAGTDLLQPITDMLAEFEQTTSTQPWIVTCGSVFGSSPADLDLLIKTLSLPPTPAEAVTARSAAHHLQLPRSGHHVAILNPGRVPVDRSRVRRFAKDIDAALCLIGAQRATRHDLEGALVRELIETQVPSAALDPWVTSFGFAAGDRVRAVAATPDQEGDDLLESVVDALADVGMVDGGPCVAAAHGGVAYALATVPDDELRNPMRNNDFDARISVMTELFARRRECTVAVGVSSYVMRTSDDLMRGLINARQLADRQARSAVPDDPQIRLPLPLSASLLASDPDLSAELERALLQPVLEYDTEKGTGLVQTLRTFLALDGHWGATANELGIHSNTLRYRLSRVEQLTGRGLQSTADRSDYYLALCLRESAGRDKRPFA